MRVEVAFALPHRQVLLPLSVARGTTAREAVRLSGIARHFPGEPLAERDFAGADLGIFGQAVDGDTPLADGDRVEIYRPLLVDPREARQRRARAGR